MEYKSQKIQNIKSEMTTFWETGLLLTLKKKDLRKFFLNCDKKILSESGSGFEFRNLKWIRNFSKVGTEQYRKSVQFHNTGGKFGSGCATRKKILSFVKFIIKCE